MTPLKIESISAIEEIPGLYISDITIPRSLELLKHHGITHVLTLTNKHHFPAIQEECGIQHLRVDVEDLPFEDLLMCFEGLCVWIESALGSATSDQMDDELEQNKEPQTPGDEVAAKQTPRVLVHCLQGQSRSGAIIIAYLMRARSIEYDTALSLARKYRPMIDPNSGFGDQLRLWRQLQYSIFTKAGYGNDGCVETKQEYENWKSNRGVLLTRDEQEKQKALLQDMVGLVATFDKTQKVQALRQI